MGEEKRRWVICEVHGADCDLRWKVCQEIEVVPAEKVERLEEALRPFAEKADRWEQGRPVRASVDEWMEARAALHPDEAQSIKS